MEHEQTAKIKEMEDERRNFLQMMDSSYPTIPPQNQMPLGQSSGQGQDLKGPSVDPFQIPNLDNLYEQEKLNKGLSKQLIDMKKQQMFDLLEERMKAIEDKHTFQGLNPDDLILVSGLVIPPHFKMPSFEKYDGTSCPEMHLIMYCNKMTVHAHNEKFLIHIFQESLTGIAFEWYLRLKRDQVRTWRDLSRAFLTQYKYMLNVAPDRSTLQDMEKKPEESYNEYAMRWKAVASQVQPPLTHREINSYFVDTLSSPYYDMLVDNVSLEFGDLLYAVRRIEYGIKKGRIASTEARVPEQRRNVADEHAQAISVRKKNKRKFNEEEEVVKNFSHSSQVKYSSSHPSVQGRDPDVNSNYSQNNKRKRAKIYNALPISYAQLLPILVQKYKIPIIPTQPRKPPYPKWYDLSARCEYHGRVQGHSTESCAAFKTKVQSLIDADPVKFQEFLRSF